MAGEAVGARSANPAETCKSEGERGVGPYRHDVIEATGIRVSTIVRESSAMEHMQPYYETMAFWLDRTPAILWQSSASFKRGADHMHDIAVRWFSREGVTFRG